MKSIFVLLVAAATACGQSTAKPTGPVHLSEYMQRVGLIYLETVDAEMKSVASTLNGDNQEHLLDQLEDSIKITLQHRDDGPEKDADTDYLTLLETLRSIAIGAGMDINQGKRDGSGVKAWAPCYALAHSAAVSGVIYPQMKQKCDDQNAIYQRDSAAAYELARACDKLKKAKDQKKCREGRIPPPS